MACVIGDMDLVRPLGLAGIRCAVVARRWEAPWFSRFTDARIPWLDPSDAGEALVQRLLDFAQRCEQPPVLYYEDDPDMLVVSRHRDVLSGPYRFVIPDRELVEKLADKASFAMLAEQLGLPVPRSRTIAVDHTDVAGIDLRYPLVVKPTRHGPTWNAISPAKAIEVHDETALRRLLGDLGPAPSTVVLQESIRGPETRIESHHVFVDRAGNVVADFTGRKIRTLPAQYGHSSALEITSDAEVRRLGRECVRRLGLHGVAKLDFKRAPDGRLWLLEVNARFTLWHHPGALAGVNLPALVFADLTGRACTQSSAVRPGITWCDVRRDFAARKEADVSLPRWGAWAVRADAKRSIAWDDPMPFVAGIAGRRLLERAVAARSRRTQASAR